ncbi:MAG: hypothetical protein ACHP8A_14520 [Terriglobales bacterium]|jgi:hypothetical protein|nr:hypothetical protein [Terriglobales bacterium]
MRRFGIVIAWTVLWLGCALLFGQQSSSHSSDSSSKHSPASKSLPERGSITNNIYRNSYFHFSYQLPFGWVDRTSDMREDTDTDKSKVLLAIFERPPAASGDTINSAVIIAAESVDSYPGLKTAADYFGPLTELTESKGFKVVNQPYDFLVDGRPVVRGDFTKERGKLEMQQASLVTLERGYVLSFTFLGGSQDEVTELVEKLSFAGRKPVSRKLEPGK